MSFSASVLAASGLKRVDVDLVLELGDRGADGARADLQQIGAAGQQRLLGHPDQMGGELVGDFRPRVGGDEDIAAATVDLAVERQRHGVAGAGRGEVAVHGDDAGDRGRSARCARRRSSSPGRTVPAAMVPA